LFDSLHFSLWVLIRRFPGRIPRHQDERFPIHDFVIQKRSMFPHSFILRSVLDIACNDVDAVRRKIF
jgi:hypothetical protein